jgi:hypothetical protein
MGALDFTDEEMKLIEEGFKSGERRRKAGELNLQPPPPGPRPPAPRSLPKLQDQE